MEGKKFSEWRKGWEGWNFGVEELGKDVVEREGWVVGEDPEELWIEDRTVGDKDGRVVVTFVE